MIQLTSASTILTAMVLLSRVGQTTQSEPFCVTRCSNTNGPSTVIDFDAECFESSISGEEGGSGFDLITDTFSPPYSGLYWLHFTAGLPDTGDLTDVQLALPNRTINIERSAGGSAGGLLSVTSRSDIVELTAGVDRLQLSTAGALYSNVSDVQVSWSGFHLDTTMADVAAFSVALSTGLFSNIGSNIPFDVVFVDTHSGWNNDRYTIPVAGLWVISLHIGDSSLEDHSVARLRVSPSEYGGFGVMSGFDYGSDMNAITFVANVAVGASVTVALASGSVYSDVTYQTAMSGFMYSPTTQPAIAWTVTLSDGSHQIGPVDPVQFGDVWINEGNGFDVGTSRFIASHRGLYYVAMAGSAIQNGGDMKMELLLNGDLKASVYYEERSSESAMTRSRAIILRLSVGDELRVRIPAGYQVYEWIDESEFTIFTGFRIQS